MSAAILHVTGADVSFQRIAETQHGYALDSHQPLLKLGTVEQSARVVDGLTQRCWEGTDTAGRRYLESTKALVIGAMAKGNGLTIVTLNDTIPPLWEEGEPS